MQRQSKIKGETVDSVRRALSESYQNAQRCQIQSTGGQVGNHDHLNIARIANAVQCHSFLSGHYECQESPPHTPKNIKIAGSYFLVEFCGVIKYRGIMVPGE